MSIPTISEVSSAMKFLCKEIGLEGFNTEIVQCVSHPGSQDEAVVHFSKIITVPRGDVSIFIAKNIQPIFDKMKGSPYFTEQLNMLQKDVRSLTSHITELNTEINRLIVFENYFNVQMQLNHGNNAGSST